MTNRAFLAAILFGATIVEAGAATETKFSFPWERQPAACENPAKGGCDSKSGPDPDQASYYLESLFSTGRFKLLDEALENILASNARFLDGRSVATAAAFAFSYMFDSKQLKGNEQDRIAQWRKVVPKSRFPAFAEAYLARERA